MKTRLLLSLVVAVVVSGCASQRLVPLPDGAAIDVAKSMATRTEDQVRVIVIGSAWKGTPGWLVDYTTPLYVVIDNEGDTPITLGWDDVVAFGENRVQYPAQPPDVVVARIRSAAPYYAAPPLPPPAFVGRYGYRYDPLWDYGYWPYYPSTLPQLNTENVIGDALPVGTVRPHARIEGFVYFTKIPKRARQVTIEVGWQRAGEPGQHQLTFPFAFERG